ncbi:MAG TPA: four helix bundle protein [Candidatus Saccharimonadales bacterium]
MKTVVNQREDLGERLSQFGENVITLCKSVKRTAISHPIVSQLVRSSTSIGANYFEAINGSSRRDFRNKIFIAKKESQETKHWLRMLAKADESTTLDVKDLSQECQEFILIFQKSVNPLDNR